MKCNRCGKEIDELEIFCDDCKKYIKGISSRSEVKELEELIENQKKLTDLENTKELVNLDKLVEEELEKEEKLEEKTAVVEIGEVKEKIEELPEELKPPKKSKKKLIITLSIIFGILIITAILLVIFLGKDKPDEEKEIVIDYEKVIKTYGDNIANIVKDYISSNEDIPTWQYVIENLDYDEYEVECKIHNIYSDGNIYLSECKINDKEIEYIYGEEQEEIKEGKKVSIYKRVFDNYSIYDSESNDNSTLVGTITCKSEDCSYINAFDKYVLIKEQEEYYLYDYTNDSINFGPFSLNNEYDLLVSNTELYGILYKDVDKNNIYNVKTGKILKDVKGTLLLDEMQFSPSVMYKYNYVILVNNGKNNFINLKTGNVSYTIEGNIGNLKDTGKLVYITAYTDDYSKFKVYNSNGKVLFDGKEYSYFTVGSNSLLVANDTSFKVYDNNLKLKTTSKKYDKILGLYEDFVVATKDSDLLLLSIEDELLASFDDGWDKENYIFHSMLSGWYTENDKYGIYLVIENNQIPLGTLGSGMEYYYIPNTKETGIIETTGIDGYAKPVLYLYPLEKTDITVTFEKPSLLTTTYPKFKNKWSVTAHPNGDLYDKKGNYYYALYWEEDRNHYIDFSEGFYVTKDNAIEFLEEKLDIIGLNKKERNEFIVYWLPILEKNSKNLVYFELTQERDYYNKLIINPKPDSILRVAIHVKKVNKKTSIKEQKLTSFKRKGYTAVEWGGVIY
ncbi:MAG: hypothetical protein E7174_05295 [Firmicutes bacterium]|nr:hypothetical protein [Bacillota bacterium]